MHCVFCKLSHPIEPTTLLCCEKNKHNPPSCNACLKCIHQHIATNTIKTTPDGEKYIQCPECNKHIYSYCYPYAGGIKINQIDADEAKQTYFSSICGLKFSN
jgi:transcription elongation factor Elf1